MSKERDFVKHLGIVCPRCGEKTRVAVTNPKETTVERVRTCNACGHVFETREVLHGHPPEPSALRGHRTQGFPCPRCGGSSMTHNTRNQVKHVRRRRYCIEAGCRIEFHTREFFAPRPRRSEPEGGGM
jgi:transcription elongation factor Elf1